MEKKTSIGFLTICLILLSLTIYYLGLPEEGWIYYPILLVVLALGRKYPVPLRRSSFLSIAFAVFLFAFFHLGLSWTAFLTLTGIILVDTLILKKPFHASLHLSTFSILPILISGYIYLKLGGKWAKEALLPANLVPIAFFLLSYFVLQMAGFYFHLTKKGKIKVKELPFLLKWEFIVYLLFCLAAFATLWSLYNLPLKWSLSYLVALTGLGLILRSLISKVILEEELEKVVEAGAIISSSLDISESMGKAREIIDELIEYTNFYIVMVDEERKRLITIYDTRVDGPAVDNVVLRMNQGLAGISYRTKKHIIVGDARKCPDRVVVEPGMNSELMYPIVSAGEVIGLFDLEHREFYHFTSRDLLLVSYIANFLTVSIRFYNLINPLKELSNTVNQFTTELSSTVEELTASAEEINATLDTMSQEIREQTKLVEDNYQKIESAFSSAKSIASQTEEADEKSKSVMELAEKNKKDVELAIDTLLEVAEDVERAAQAVARFEKISGQITHFTSTILQIATRTNVVALNASVEAAKAGEFGREFSVVAEEISKLAGSTKQASEEIKEAINLLLARLNAINNIMRESKEKVEDASKIARDSEESFTEILSSIEEKLSFSEKISSYTNTQRELLADITEAMKRIEEANKKNAQGIENIVSAIEQQSASLEQVDSNVSELDRLVSNLHQGISRFIKS
jgi:methyl-accepting chemotaxis protein